jgi:cytochrome c553
MRQVFYGIAVASLGLALVVTFPPAAWSYASFQRLPNVSDAEPFCAGCHASVDASYHPELPPEASQAQVYTTKHYKALEEGSFPGYKALEPEQRKQLLDQAKKMDQNSSVKLEASAPTVAPGGNLTVTVTTKGGIGPVVGIMLLDEPLRYQARPLQGTGWFIAGPPEVIGADGKPQSKWLDRRFNKQQTNLNFVLVYDIASDPAKDMYATTRVSYVLKAPSTPGEYPMTAAFLYGTAEANEMKSGKYEDPPGGNGAPSGRIQFSNTVKVRVQ